MNLKNKILILIIYISSTIFSQDIFFSKADIFFTKHVKNNNVNYSKIKESPEELYQLLDYISTNKIQKNHEKAYLINVYNIFVIAGIIEHYPINSSQEITSFFEEDKFVIDHKKINLNYLEKEIIFNKYNDPNLHFVLVCGAKGCPPIRDKAYQTINLDKVIKQQVLSTLNSSFIKQDSIKKTISISELFKWYIKDFGGSEKSILEFISLYNKGVNQNYLINYYTYDWQLNDYKPRIKTTQESNKTNLQTYTAGSLLKKNQFDFTLFNSLYTESKSNWENQNFTGFRNTFNTHLLQVTYGMSQSKRINIGVDFNLRNNGTTPDSTLIGINEAFQYRNTATSRFGLANIGVRIKLQPIKNLSNFSIQSTLSLPTIKFPEGNSNLYWADWDRITFWNQFFFSKTFSKFQLFTELDLLFRIKKYDTQINIVDIPISLFFSYFPNKKWTIYAMTQHLQRIPLKLNSNLSTNDWIIPANYSAYGLGLKYQLSSAMNIELLYSNFWRGKNTGFGNTINLGIKYITK